MTLVTGPLLPFAALAWPVILAGVAALPRMRRRGLALLPLAPLPALLLALAGPRTEPSAVPDLLLGIALALSAEGALFLGTAAFLWLVAGVYALTYLRGTHRPGVFAAFWCLTLAGNLGVFLARDVATFYVAFSAVSLAAWVLVVHEETDRALRAGRIYIILAIAGETALLFGLLLSVSAADSVMVEDVRAALATGFAGRDAALALIVAGLGVKAGLVPLHVWLPLAHPEAPTPASAVLSGAIVKAGIFGLLLLLPAGGAADLGAMVTWAGLGTAFFGILAGLTQRQAKAILAYSTVSQMGLLIAVAGAATGGPDAAAAHATAAFYAAHHGLAKGALFLAVGVIVAAGGRSVVPVVLLTALVAGSVAGLALTGGAAAKAAVKEPFGDGLAGALVALSAVGTALLLLHFLARVLAERRGRAPAGAPPRGLLVPWLATAAAALVVPWILLPGFTDLSRAYLLQPSHLWSAVWPVAVAGGLALVAAATGLSAPRLPAGDLVVPVERMAGRIGRGGGALAARARAAARDFPRLRGGDLEAWLLHRVPLERHLRSWSVAGFLVILAALLL